MKPMERDSSFKVVNLKVIQLINHMAKMIK
jgi:hypothetical protein